MDQFGMELGHGELGHGEIAMDFSDETLLGDKFSPRRTRSGRVYDSCSKRRRDRGGSQQSPRSRNSSGQSTGSVGDSSDQEQSEEYFNLSSSYFQSSTRPPSRRLDLSESKDQELPISSFLDDILSPKKFKWRDQSSPLKCPTLPHHMMDTWARRRFSFPANWEECDSNTTEKLKLTNINPFSPSTRASVARKRNNSQKSNWSCNASLEASILSGGEECEEEEDQQDYEISSSPLSSKRLKVSDINITRYEEEFVEIDKIASGEFGVVKRARHRLDGMVYAIKMTKKPLKDNSRSEQTAMREVFAGAAMMKHKHIVRYYNSWVEAGLVFIQNEFCDGGSLQALIDQHRQDETHFTEPEVRRMIVHIGKGLQYVHSLQLAHLDVKPGNILISTAYEDSGELGADQRTYKLADFGHVVPLEGEEVEPEEGDCRYMAPELLELNIDRSKLTQADIFSLGLSMYEAGSLMLLPKNSLDDPNYEKIKRGELQYLSWYSEDLNSLMMSLVNQDSSLRPSATEIVTRLEDTELSLKTKLEQTREKVKYLESRLNMRQHSGDNIDTNSNVTTYYQ